MGDACSFESLIRAGHVKTGGGDWQRNSYFMGNLSAVHDVYIAILISGALVALSILASHVFFQYRRHPLIISFWVCMSWAGANALLTVFLDLSPGPLTDKESISTQALCIANAIVTPGLWTAIPVFAASFTFEAQLVIQKQRDQTTASFQKLEDEQGSTPFNRRRKWTLFVPCTAPLLAGAVPLGLTVRALFQSNTVSFDGRKWYVAGNSSHSHQVLMIGVGYPLVQ